MDFKNWADNFDCAITVCDTEANILYINEKASATFKRFGDNLTGRNLKEFHGERAWTMITKMISENQSNHYTIDKGGVKKIVHQKPWYENGKVMGLVEFSMEIPMDMAHYDRG